MAGKFATVIIEKENCELFHCGKLLLPKYSFENKCH